MNLRESMEQIDLSYSVRCRVCFYVLLVQPCNHSSALRCPTGGLGVGAGLRQLSAQAGNLSLSGLGADVQVTQPIQNHRDIIGRVHLYANEIPALSQKPCGSGGFSLGGFGAGLGASHLSLRKRECGARLAWPFAVASVLGAGHRGKLSAQPPHLSFSGFGAGLIFPSFAIFANTFACLKITKIDVALALIAPELMKYSSRTHQLPPWSPRSIQAIVSSRESTRCATFARIHIHHSGTLFGACLETTSLSLFHASSVQPSFVSTFVGQRPQDAHALDSLSGCVFGVHRTIRTHFFDKNLSCLPEPITETSNLGGFLHYLCFLF